MSAVLESPVPAFDAQTPLGEIAVRLPGATAVFRKLKLDFCCGGNIPLGQAARSRGLDAAAVLRQLAALDRQGADASIPTEPGALVDHILARYHEVHRQQLPELERMARRVEAVHADHPAVPAGLAAVLDAMQQEMLSHMAKEEQVLFPMLRANHPMASHPIAMMRHEHNEHGRTLDEIDRLTDDLTPPAGACNTWRALYIGLAALKDDLMQHIHLENNVLFPQFEAAPKSGCGCGGGSGGCGSGATAR